MTHGLASITLSHVQIGTSARLAIQLTVIPGQIRVSSGSVPDQLRVRSVSAPVQIRSPVRLTGAVDVRLQDVVQVLGVVQTELGQRDERVELAAAGGGRLPPARLLVRPPPAAGRPQVQPAHAGEQQRPGTER